MAHVPIHVYACVHAVSCFRTSCTQKLTDLSTVSTHA